MLWASSRASSVFEIGSTLREARTRQGLELHDAQQATRIRARYLAALEEERFDRLPAEAYAKAFLRTYADYLGLDSALFVAELEARFEASRPAAPPQPTRAVSLPSLDLRPVAALSVALAVVAAGVLAWRLDGDPEEQTQPVVSPRPPEATTTAPAPPAKRGGDGSSGLARLAVTASRGDCWLSVRVGSRDGRVLYEGTLREGDSLRFARTRLWVRMGAPWNLEARLNGRALRGLPAATGNVFITRAGVRPA
jgi:cytoskeleton protein RodZ